MTEVPLLIVILLHGVEVTLTVIFLVRPLARLTVTVAEPTFFFAVSLTPVSPDFAAVTIPVFEELSDVMLSPFAYLTVTVVDFPVFKFAVVFERLIVGSNFGTVSP